jgi:signal transduction histidine kinase
MIDSAPALNPEASYPPIYDKLVVSIIALENFLAEIRLVSGRDDILSLTLSQLKSLLPIDIAGFFFSQDEDQEFHLHTKLEPEAAGLLTAMVDQAIESGVFGWALNHLRPAAFRASDGQTTLILAALRTRHRVLGMFAGTFSSQSAAGWDPNTIVLATYLACAAEAIRSEELTCALQEHNRKLDYLVQQRTQQLQDAKVAAEAANQTKGRFLATISHELRTPLNAILGYTQIMLGEESCTTRQHAQLGVIQQSADHLLSLINDLLDFTKAESSSVELVPGPVSLKQLVQEVAASLSPQAEEKALQFNCDLAPDLPALVLVDARRLKQVLFNLLGNAIKFTDHGTVRLEVSRSNQRLKFAVSDTGCGIGPDDISKLFQPFQQLGDPSHRARGTGLGLAISSKILQAMGGEIQVQSDVGHGSTFRFELDCAAWGVEPAGDPLPGADHPGHSTATGSRAALSSGQIQQLRELAARGNILELQKEVERLKADMSSSPSILARLSELAAACRIKAVRELLDTYERNRPHC